MAATLTREQWTAARMLLSRMRCEATGDEFSLEDLGITWLEVDDLVCAKTDEGLSLRIGDLMMAGIVLLWSQILDTAEIVDEDPSEIVSALALGLLDSEPTGS